MCVLTHENQVVMQMTSQFLSFPSTQPLKYLVFTMSATTRSYEKSQWTRVRFPTRRDVFVAARSLKHQQKERWMKFSGQISLRPHTTKNPSNGVLLREIPLFQGNLGWWNMVIWCNLGRSFDVRRKHEKIKKWHSKPRNNPLGSMYPRLPNTLKE